MFLRGPSEFSLNGCLNGCWVVLEVILAQADELIALHHGNLFGLYLLGNIEPLNKNDLKLSVFEEVPLAIT